jgi:hypothetical protein
MKITRSHTSTTETANVVIKELKKIKSIQKIGISIIKNTRSKSGQKSIKIKTTSSGLKISVRGNGSVQDLYVYSDTSEDVRGIIEKNLSKNIKTA